MQSFQFWQVCINLLPYMPILDSSNSEANKNNYDVKSMDKWGKIIWLSRKHCRKRRKCSLKAISSFHTMFSNAVCCWCIKVSIYGVRVILLVGLARISKAEVVAPSRSPSNCYFKEPSHHDVLVNNLRMFKIKLHFQTSFPLIPDDRWHSIGFTLFLRYPAATMGGDYQRFLICQKGWPEHHGVKAPSFLLLLHFFNMASCSVSVKAWTELMDYSLE